MPLAQCKAEIIQAAIFVGKDLIYEQGHGWVFSLGKPLDEKAIYKWRRLVIFV